MSRLNQCFCIATLLVGGILLFNFNIGKADTNMNPTDMRSGPSMKGLCWVAGDSVAMHNIGHIVDIGANWISQTPFGFMEGHQSTEIRTSYDKAWWGETDRGLRHTAELARAKGIKTMLKPHIWLRSDDNKWRSDVAMTSESDWEKWFDSYGDMMIHYAELAEECKMESLCIGTELHATTVSRPDQWRELIKKIRKVYSGDLTYAANWYKEFEEIEFWDDLDYIGVQAYFPLSNGNGPSKSELLNSWKRHNLSLAKVSNRFNKKIVFTEIGYKNTADSAKEPWSWPELLGENIEVSEKVQLDCYNALFESVWHEPWFDGMFVWKWFHSTHRHENLHEYLFKGQERRIQRDKDRTGKVRPLVYFSPQYGHAKNILADWYKRE